MVSPIIEDNRDAIAALCRKHRVRALWIFGSAVTDAFDPDTSDVDLLVDPGDDDHIHRRFYGLRQDLELLTGRPVDLITVHSVENPYFREELMETRKQLYGPTGADVLPMPPSDPPHHTTIKQPSFRGKGSLSLCLCCAEPPGRGGEESPQLRTREADRPQPKDIAPD